MTVRLYAEGTLPSCDDKFVSGTDEAQRIGNGKLDDLVLEATAEHCPDPDAVDWYYANITVFETNDEKNVLWFREYDCTTNLMTNPVTVDCRARK